MAPRKRSEMWMYFTDIDGSKAKCDLCHSVFSHHGGGTTNLKRHLDRKHPTVLQKQSNRPVRVPEQSVTSVCVAPTTVVLSSTNLNDTQSSTAVRDDLPALNPGPSSLTGQMLQQPTLSRYITRPASVSRQKRLNNELLKFIIKDFQPFSVVNDEGFRNFCRALDPSYPLPSRSLLTRSLLPQHYEMCLNNINNFISQMASVAITTDTWTSIANEGYMAITAHVIDDNWQIGRVLLSCIDVSSSRHTAEFLKEKMLQCFGSYKIEKKISAVVSDNAANISSAIRLTKFEHIRCIAHTINLIVQEGVKEVADIQRKVKTIVEYFHRSTIASDKLKTLQIQINGTENPIKLIMDVITRWNSTFHMFERFCQLREPIEAALAVLHVEHVEMLTSSEMVTLQEICDVLKPFDGLTSELSAENSVTISKILVIIEGVKHYLENISVTTNKATALVRVIKSKLYERFQNAEQNFILQCSTYLDPRFKGKLFSESSLKLVKDRLTKLVADLIQREGQNNNINILEIETAEDTPHAFWSYFDQQNPVRAVNSPTALAIIELRQYSEEAIIPRREDPLKWWQSRNLIYPHLAIIAKRLLAIPASSVSSERIFSKTGLILTERRNRIKPKNLEKVVFLNANYKFYDL